MFFIRNRRYSLIFLSGFTRGEYHVIRVDFIVALRRTKGRGRRTLRSPPSPSSGLHLIHPGLSAAAGKCWLPRVYRDIGICIPVQIDNPQFGIWCSYLCSARYRSRFSRFRWAYVFRFSLLVGWTVRACGYVGVLPKSFVGFALTAVGSFVLVDTVMEYQIISSLSCTNAFLQ